MPGWVLIVPRDHRLAIAGMEPHKTSDLEILVARALARLRGTFGSVTLFEHGAHRPGTTFGCGIDHAHLHLVPLPFDLVHAVTSSSNDEPWVRTGPPWLRSATGPYLTVSSDARSWFTQTPRAQPARQFFRRVIAQHIGMRDFYDYDLHPFDANVVATREAWSSSEPSAFVTRTGI